MAQVVYAQPGQMMMPGVQYVQQVSWLSHPPALARPAHLLRKLLWRCIVMVVGYSMNLHDFVLWEQVMCWELCVAYCGDASVSALVASTIYRRIR